MPFSGTGVFNRLYSWAADAAAALKISSSRMDDEFNGIAAGLTNCMTRDGQSPATANIPMGGFKLTGLANATASTDAVAYGQADGRYAQLAGISTQAFNVANATLGPHAINLTTGDGRYGQLATINTWDLTQTFTAATKAPGYAFTVGTAIVDADETNIAVKPPNGGRLFVIDVAGTRCTVECADALSNTQAVTLGQADGRYARVSAPAPRNYIIGGDFSTNPWQRGTSFPNATAGLYTAERFNFEISNSGTWTAARVADAPTFAQAGRQITYCLEHLVTAADTSVAAGDYAYVSQFIEGYNYLPLYKKPQLIGFWAKSNVLGDYGVSLRGAADSVSYVGTITINVADTWEYKTLAITTAPVGGTWNFDVGVGAKVAIALVCGTTYQTSTLNSWVSGNFVAPATQVNLAATVGNYFRIADVKLIEGTVDVTPYQPTAQEVLAECQRYYQTGVASARFAASAANQYMNTPIYFPVRMRAAPTVVLTAGTRSNLGAVPGIFLGVSGGRLEIISAAAGDTYALDETFTASAEL